MATAKFIGVYTCNTWPTKSPSGRKTNWFVWEDDWGRYRVQLLDAAFEPLDSPRVITTAEFKKHFTAQPNILVTPLKQLDIGSREEEEAKQAAELEKARRVKQDIAELSAKLGIEVAADPTLPAQAEVSVDDLLSEDHGTDPALAALAAATGTTVGAESADAPKAEQKLSLKEYERAAQLDNETRTDFALALTRWRRGDKDRAMMTFKSILKLNQDIMPPHKHMFTDFAIDLRKCALATLAKEFYRRAVDLAPDDTNALFNLARINFETGEIHNAVEALDKALEIEPDFDYALRFRKFLFTNYPKQLRVAEDGSPKKKTTTKDSDFRLFIEK